MFRITCNLQYSSPWQWSKILWTNCSNWISADQISLTQNPKLQALITIQSTFLQSYLQQHIVSMTTHINWWRKRKAGPDKASISTLTTPTIWLRHLWRSLWYSAWMAQFNIILVAQNVHDIMTKQQNYAQWYNSFFGKNIVENKNLNLPYLFSIPSSSFKTIFI